jgi:hypothetical protein
VVNVRDVPGFITKVFEGIKKVIWPISAAAVAYFAFLAILTRKNNPQKSAQLSSMIRYAAIGFGIIIVAYVLGLALDSVIQCITQGVC